MAKQKLSDRVKELEAQLQEAREELVDLYEATKNDIVEDTRSIGAGDVVYILAGAVIGFTLGAILI